MKTHLLCLVLVTATSPVFAQTCNSAIKPSTPTNRFIITRQGTAIDKETGLEWMRCVAGRTWNGANCAGGSAYGNWQQALDTAEASTFAGHDDWRLPNLKELTSIIEVACYLPALNTQVFFDPGSYWSSTTYAFDPTRATYVGVNYSGAGVGGGDFEIQKSTLLGIKLVRRALPEPVAP